jgi:hypothetical protein
MTDNIRCPNCEDGFVIVEEDGRRIRDACYHCANTGFISPEQHRLDQIEGMAASLATSVVQKMKRACNTDPEGEGWAFHAAEAGMREYEYTTARVMSKADDFGKSLVALDQTNPQLISALLDRMAPDVEIEDCSPILVLVREDDPPADDVPF